MSNSKFRSTQTKFLSKPGKFIPLIKDKNIFLTSKPSKEAFQNLTMYAIVGDQQFKTKFLKQNTMDKTVSFHEESSPIQQKALDQQKNSNFILTLRQQQKVNTTNNPYFGSTIFFDQKQKTRIFSHLNKIQKNASNRQNRILNNFKQRQKSWSQIEKNLKWQMKKNQTVTFTSVKKLYHHENPQKIQIINDMIPQFWEKSLRNNDKKLKAHIKGNPFKKQLAEEMLQTLRGNQKLQQSIPKIPIYKTIDIVHKGFSLKGKERIKQGMETMRSFHKTFFQETKKKEEALNSLKFPKKLKQLENQSFCKKYSFSKDLQDLDKIDNQLYKRQFQRKKKWLNQGYDF